MEYRSLGRTGVKVSAIGLGCWMLGDAADEEESHRIVAAALDAGINFLDLANNYGGAPGRSERVVGAALAKLGSRDRVVINSKVYMPVDPTDPNGSGISRRHIIQQCEQSLRNLGTDYLDVYTLHRLDASVPVDEPLRALDDLVRAGKVRYLGVSTAAAWQIVEALWVSKELGLHRFVAETPPYNVLDRRIERELVPMAETFGLAINPWAPLGAGILTGVYSRGVTPPPGSRYGQGGILAGLAGNRLTDRVFDVIDVLQRLASEKGVTLAELAFSWVLRQRGITSVLAGPEKVDDLTSCLTTLGIEWTDADRAAVDEVSPPGQHVAGWYEPWVPGGFGPHPHRTL